METAIKPPPPRPIPPPPIKQSARNGDAPLPTKGKFKIDVGVKTGMQKVVIYSSGGAGKTSLAASLSQVGITPLILDLEQGSKHCDVSRIDTIESWDDLRSILHDQELLRPFGAIVIDSLTKAEEMATAWTLENVPHEKGHFVSSIEGYGFGKGVTYVYETMLRLIGDLDAIARSGKHVVCTAHECVTNVPNPTGEDWIRYEPRLQSPTSGKSSVRHKIKEWADSLLFIGYDTYVTKDGKGQGSGTRTIYPCEMPTHLAKSRSLSEPIPYVRGSADLWKQVFGG